MKRLTIKDIARALNMHHSTVSRALRDDNSVSQDTRKKVLAYAREHGYQINRSALQLRGESSKVIGMVVPNVNHSFFSNVISEITDLAFQNGYIVSVFQSNESLEQEEQIVKAMIQNNVAGVLASVSMETRKGDHFRLLEKFRIPLVLFDRVTTDLEVPAVLVRNKKIVKETVSFLVKRGFSRIAHLTGNPEVNVFKERQLGYHEGLMHEKLSYERSQVIHAGFTVENGRSIVKQLFEEKNKPDAIICDSHFLLLGALVELRNRNIDLISDFGLIGFGGNAETGIVNPGVMTIEQPEKEIAHEAFNQLLYAINGAATNKQKPTCFDAHIIVTNQYN